MVDGSSWRKCEGASAGAIPPRPVGARPKAHRPSPGAPGDGPPQGNARRPGPSPVRGGRLPVHGGVLDRRTTRGSARARTRPSRGLRPRFRAKPQATRGFRRPLPRGRHGVSPMRYVSHVCV
ncbi:hypothetical protein DEH69_25505 [Streptomyces sp. PT12]|nr:hypothetical protein DEH69_25505 [Streptomyces sp. PT12]